MQSLELNKELDYREEIRRAIEVSHQRLVNAVENHITKSTEPINMEALESFPENVWVEMGKNIKAKKRKNRFFDFLNFDVHMKAGAKFSEHFHDDAIESTEVVEGEMVDIVSEEIYKKGDVAHYNKGIKHKPVALKETLLHVLFKKE